MTRAGGSRAGVCRFNAVPAPQMGRALAEFALFSIIGFPLQGDRHAVGERRARAVVPAVLPLLGAMGGVLMAGEPHRSSGPAGLPGPGACLSTFGSQF